MHWPPVCCRTKCGSGLGRGQLSTVNRNRHGTVEGSERQRIPSTGARGVGLTAAADDVCQKLRQVMQGANVAHRDRQITGCSRCRLTQSVLQGKAGGALAGRTGARRFLRHQSPAGTGSRPPALGGRDRLLGGSDRPHRLGAQVQCAQVPAVLSGYRPRAHPLWAGGTGWWHAQAGRTGAGSHGRSGPWRWPQAPWACCQCGS